MRFCLLGARPDGVFETAQIRFVPLDEGVEAIAGFVRCIAPLEGHLNSVMRFSLARQLARGSEGRLEGVFRLLEQICVTAATSTACRPEARQRTVCKAAGRGAEGSRVINLSRANATRMSRFS